jgi:hypothetical protein
MATSMICWSNRSRLWRRYISHTAGEPETGWSWGSNTLSPVPRALPVCKALGHVQFDSTFGSSPYGTKNARDTASVRSCGSDAVRGKKERKSQSWYLQLSAAGIRADARVLRFGRNSHQNERDRFRDKRCMYEERRGSVHGGGRCWRCSGRRRSGRTPGKAAASPWPYRSSCLQRIWSRARLPRFGDLRWRRRGEPTPDALRNCVRDREGEGQGEVSRAPLSDVVAASTSRCGRRRPRICRPCGIERLSALVRFTAYYSCCDLWGQTQRIDS